MSATQTSPMQTLVNLLGTSGPLTGVDLINQSGLGADVVKAEMFGLIQQGYATQDGSYFDVVESLRVAGRDNVKEPQVVYDAGQAPTAPVAPAAPRPTAPAPPQAPAAAGSKKGGGKKAPAPSAPPQGVQVPNAPAATTAPKYNRLYFSDPMDTLTVDELKKRVEVALNAAAANFAYGGDNALIAEILERWAIRAMRRINGIGKGKSVVRPKGTAGDE